MDERELRRALGAAMDALTEHRRNRPAHSVPTAYALRLEALEEEVERLESQLGDRGG